MECTATQSKAHCTCTYASCDKRGNCCKCVMYHRDRGEVPGCFFTAKGERSYDRSLRNLCRDHELI